MKKTSFLFLLLLTISNVYSSTNDDLSIQIHSSPSSGSLSPISPNNIEEVTRFLTQQGKSPSNLQGRLSVTQDRLTKNCPFVTYVLYNDNRSVQGLIYMGFCPNAISDDSLYKSAFFNAMHKYGLGNLEQNQNKQFIYTPLYASTVHVDLELSSSMATTCLDTIISPTIKTIYQYMYFLYSSDDRILNDMQEQHKQKLFSTLQDGVFYITSHVTPEFWSTHKTTLQGSFGFEVMQLTNNEGSDVSDLWVWNIPLNSKNDLDFSSKRRFRIFARRSVF